MRISFSPRLAASPLPDVSTLGDVITIGGQEYDFSPLAGGDVLPRDAVDCPWLASDVVRIDGEIVLTLFLPHGLSAPQETLFPAEIIAGDGPLIVPPFEAPQEAAE